MTDSSLPKDHVLWDTPETFAFAEAARVCYLAGEDYDSLKDIIATVDELTPDEQREHESDGEYEALFGRPKPQAKPTPPVTVEMLEDAQVEIRKTREALKMSESARWNELIADARLKLHRVDGELTKAEKVEEAQRVEIEKFKGLCLRQFGVVGSLELMMKWSWLDGRPAAILTAEDRHIFHLHKIDDKKKYGLFRVAGDGVEREITRIEDTDANFGPRAIVAIADEIRAGKGQDQA